MIGDITIITFGPREYLRRIGWLTTGELEYINVTPRRHTIAEIQQMVADRYQLPVSIMKSDRRGWDVARPRQVAMSLCKTYTRNSLPQIGRKFGDRDHTTVMHAIRRIEQLRSEDPELNNHVTALEQQLEAGR